MIRLVNTDFDGTIFDAASSPPVPKELLSWLRTFSQKGGKWAICSGRELTHLVIDRLYLAQDHNLLPDYIVTAEREIHELSNGTYRPVEPWNSRSQAELDAFFCRIPVTLEQIRRWVESSRIARWYRDQWSQLNIIANDDARADQVYERLLAECRQQSEMSVARNGTYFRIAICHYNKGVAVREIARRLNLAREEVFAAGDHCNDLTMLDGTCAGYMAAPSNAALPVKEAVRKAGGYVARESHGHGVLEALRHFQGK